VTSQIPEPKPGSVPDLRVSDAEREAVAHQLTEALTEGRITLAEFDERVGVAYAAKTRADLLPLTADLSAQPRFAVAQEPAGPVSGEGGVDWTVAVLSGSERTGRWRPGRHTHAVAVMGGCELDLREAVFPDSPLVITAVAVMGGIEIIVPEGVEVEVTGLSIMGGRDVNIADVPRGPGTPVVRVRAFAVMGGVDIKTKRPRGETSRKKERKRLDRA
jgi:Domain of unknown function (DUF1707)/Cell wall-active antibiotics response 4TMS YvqF